MSRRTGERPYVKYGKTQGGIKELQIFKQPLALPQQHKSKYLYDKLIVLIYLIGLKFVIYPTTHFTLVNSLPNAVLRKRGKNLLNLLIKHQLGRLPFKNQELRSLKPSAIFTSFRKHCSQVLQNIVLQNGVLHDAIRANNSNQSSPPRRF